MSHFSAQHSEQSKHFYAPCGSKKLALDPLKSALPRGLPTRILNAAYPPREASAEGISPERSENCEAISLEVCSMRGAFGAWAATETVGG